MNCARLRLPRTLRECTDGPLRGGIMHFPCRLQLLSRRNGTILRCIIRFLHRFQSQSHRKWHIPQGSAALIVCAMKSPVIIHFEVAGHMGPYAKTVFTADKTLARLILLDQSS